ncbi:hypothetical protein TNCV_623651 [Trichonephila clavipes]|nr:hypothetical protein TNCV_623651 [Trichonephila clavipes]
MSEVKENCSLLIPHLLTEVQKGDRYVLTDINLEIPETHFCRMLSPLLRRGHEPMSVNQMNDITEVRHFQRSFNRYPVGCR